MKTEQIGILVAGAVIVTLMLTCFRSCELQHKSFDVCVQNTHNAAECALSTGLSRQ